MMFYRFHPETGEFLVARVAPVDPLGSAIASEQAGEPVTVYAEPGQHDTTTPPPDAGEHQAAVWADGAWSLVDDYRGETRWRSYAESYVVQELGTPEGTAERPAAPPPTTAELIAYAADKRWRVATAGISVPLPGGGALSIPSDDVAYGRLKGAAEDLAAGIITEPITIVIGATVLSATLAIAQALYAAISQHWQACYGVQGQVVTSINAGTITTLAEIDAAAWPGT